MYVTTHQPENTETENLQNPPDKAPAYTPFLTIAFIVICSTIFIAANLDKNSTSSEGFLNWVAPSTYYIWEGRIWGLLTSAFVHIQFMHIFFNMYWLWTFGPLLERANGRMHFLLLVISSAMVSSAVEFGLLGSAGIGFSGVVYAMFGYIFVMSKLEPDRWKIPQNITITFIGWGILCIVLTYARILNIANGAHFGGLAWGALFAYLPQFTNRTLRFAIPAAIITVLAVPLFWAPWLSDWWVYRGYNLNRQQDIPGAKNAYQKALSMDPENELAKTNLKIIDDYDQLKALGENGKTEEMTKLCKEIIELGAPSDWLENCAAGFPQNQSKDK